MQPTIDHLKNLRSELTRRINAIEADIHHKKEPVEKDFAEQVTQRENDDVLSAIDEEAKQTVHLIDTALIRLKNGSYGTCAICGEKIPDARLDALPYVTTCVNCAE
jgi:RNA polymerase-binding transcription factor DksA